MLHPILVVKNLTKYFGEQIVIQNLSFSITQGQRLTLFAPSGAGKTTLITILTGIDRGYSGQVSLTAKNPVTIFQEPRLFPYMTVEENIFLPLILHKIHLTPRQQKIYRQWITVCDLSASLQHYPCQLSGGMKQKVALIRGFITQPDFVMMDEPFKSIDRHAKQAIIHHLITTYPQTSVLFVTHNPDEIPLLTHSVLFFKKPILQDFVEQNAVAFNSDYL